MPNKILTKKEFGEIVAKVIRGEKPRKPPRLRVIMLSDPHSRLIERSIADPSTLFVATNCSRFARDGVIVETSVPVGRVMLLLAATKGRVSQAQVIECLWGHRHDGGPDAVDSIVRVTVSNARTLAAALQLAVTTSYKFGWEFRDLRNGAKSAPDVASL